MSKLASQLASLMHTAKTIYDANDLPYHNWQHVELVMAAHVCNFSENIAETLAIVFHDVVYIPRFLGNERASAAMAKHRLTLEGLSEYAEEVYHLIIGTTIQYHLSDRVTEENDPSMARILDCDIFSLSLPFGQFDETQRRVILEHGAVTSESLKKSAVFLSQFLKKRQIFRTTRLSRLEDAARENIKEWGKLHG